MTTRIPHIRIRKNRLDGVIGPLRVEYEPDMRKLAVRPSGPNKRPVVMCAMAEQEYNGSKFYCVLPGFRLPMTPEEIAYYSPILLDLAYMNFEVKHPEDGK